MRWRISGPVAKGVGNIAYGFRLAGDGEHLEPDDAEQAVLKQISELTRLVLLPSRVPFFVAGLGAFLVRVAFLGAGASSGATSGVCGARGVSDGPSALS